MFGRAAITLGIGPHSSLHIFSVSSVQFNSVAAMCTGIKLRSHRLQHARLPTPRTDRRGAAGAVLRCVAAPDPVLVNAALETSTSELCCRVTCVSMTCLNQVPCDE